MIHLVSCSTRLSLALNGQGVLDEGQEFLAAVDAAGAVGANIVLGRWNLSMSTHHNRVKP